MLVCSNLLYFYRRPHKNFIASTTNASNCFRCWYVGLNLVKKITLSWLTISTHKTSTISSFSCVNVWELLPDGQENQKFLPFRMLEQSSGYEIRSRPFLRFFHRPIVRMNSTQVFFNNKAIFSILGQDSIIRRLIEPPKRVEQSMFVLEHFSRAQQWLKYKLLQNRMALLRRFPCRFSKCVFSCTLQ